MASVGHNTISAVIYFVYPYLVVYLSMEKNYPSQFKGPISVNPATQIQAYTIKILFLLLTNII